MIEAESRNTSDDGFGDDVGAVIQPSYAHFQDGSIDLGELLVVNSKYVFLDLGTLP